MGGGGPWDAPTAPWGSRGQLLGEDWPGGQGRLMGEAWWQALRGDEERGQPVVLWEPQGVKAKRTLSRAEGSH